MPRREIIEDEEEEEIVKPHKSFPSIKAKQQDEEEIKVISNEQLLHLKLDKIISMLEKFS